MVMLIPQRSMGGHARNVVKTVWGMTGWPESTLSDVRCLIVRFLCDWKHFSRASSILTQKSEQKDNKMWFCPQIGDTDGYCRYPKFLNLRWENEKRFGLRGTMGYLVSMIMSLIWVFIFGWGLHPPVNHGGNVSVPKLEFHSYGISPGIF